LAFMHMVFFHLLWVGALAWQPDRNCRTSSIGAYFLREKELTRRESRL